MFTKFSFPLKIKKENTIILTSWQRNTTIVFTLNMESCIMLIGRCHGNDEWRMDFFRRLIQRLSWIMVSSFAQLKARNERKRKKNSQMLAALVVQTLEQMFSAKQAYILPYYVHLPRLTVHLHTFVLTSSKSCSFPLLQPYDPKNHLYPFVLTFYFTTFEIPNMHKTENKHLLLLHLKFIRHEKNSWNCCRIKTIRKSRKFMPLQFDDCISTGTADPF